MRVSTLRPPAPRLGGGHSPLLSKKPELLVERYLADLPFALPADQPFIRNRSGHDYSKDTLGAITSAL
jgi:hypothetical protein